MEENLFAEQERTDTAEEAYTAPVPERPGTYLVWAILATALCCMPLGVVSIVYAAQVSTLYDTGRYAEAQKASRNARRWAVWSAVTGGAAILVYILALLAMVLVDTL